MFVPFNSMNRLLSFAFNFVMPQPAEAEMDVRVEVPSPTMEEQLGPLPQDKFCQDVYVQTSPGAPPVCFHSVFPVEPAYRLREDVMLRIGYIDTTFVTHAEFQVQSSIDAPLLLVGLYKPCTDWSEKDFFGLCLEDAERKQRYLLFIHDEGQDIRERCVAIRRVTTFVRMDEVDPAIVRLMLARVPHSV